MSEAHVLVGAADPGGRGLGFLLPVFRLHPSNRLLAQRVSLEGEIEGFDPVRFAGLRLLNVPSDAARVGEEARWVFALGADDVLVGAGDQGRRELERRLDDAPLSRMPALAFEVAEFLDLRERRAEFAAQTFKRLARASETAARRWRDLSVLTPDLRAALSSLVEGGDAIRVVAAADDGVVTVMRPGRVTAVVEEAVRSAVRKALAGLEPLYGPASDWKVKIVEGGAASRRARRADASIYAPDPHLQGLVRELAGSRALDLEGFAFADVAEFALAVQAGGRPGFLVGEADDDERLQEGAAGLGIDLVALRLVPPALVLRPLVATPASLPTIVVPTPSGRASGSTRAPSRAGPVVQAIAVALAVVEARGGVGSLPPRSVLVRARGIGPDRDTDAWLAIQDRAWALGLDAYTALRAGPSIRRLEDHGFGADWAARGFYRQRDPVDGVALDPALAAMRTEAAALLPIEEPDGMADVRRFIGFQDVLDQQGWRLSRGRSERPRPINVSGARWAFELDPRDRPVPSRWRMEPLLENSFRDIATVVVTPEAGPGGMLSRLFGYWELTASVRDLARLPSGRSTVYTLLGNQLRRVAAGMPSRARSQFVALLIHDALVGGEVDPERRDDLHAIVRHPELGSRLVLGLRRTRTVAAAVESEVHPSLLDDERRPWDVIGRPRPFRLVVHDDGVAVVPLPGPDEGRE